MHPVGIKSLGTPVSLARLLRQLRRVVLAGRQRSRATPSDAEIEASMRIQLAKSKIGKDGFRFHVQRGVVTWEGTTNVMQHKGSATRMAKAAGATRVINNIQVSAAAKAKANSNLKKAYVEPQ